jgi:hypothetical protein
MLMPACQRDARGTAMRGTHCDWRRLSHGCNACRDGVEFIDGSDTRNLAPQLSSTHGLSAPLDNIVARAGQNHILQ